MAMVNMSARRPHRSRIAHAFGILALFGAATTLVVLVRDPALSSTRLAEPVPAPEITVVQTEPLRPGGTAGDWDDYLLDDQVGEPTDEPAGPYGGNDRASTGAVDRGPAATDRATGAHGSSELSRSLFWSGVFGLAISLAGLGLVGTRRRMW
ncbi:hypothetical protein [Micromonospora radicis]|uniref:Uncharacterized protein n=1 Tax=Micromonospora radicis TaxID=1894971 RepID=A0A418MW05_9ACTN|nr:hypothetical protein [Micromonospora radicis]RIV38986.1 hypothetical protein D2L64_11250 [Micromonospora radicis]